MEEETEKCWEIYRSSRLTFGVDDTRITDPIFKWGLGDLLENVRKVGGTREGRTDDKGK